MALKWKELCLRMFNVSPQFLDLGLTLKILKINVSFEYISHKICEVLGTAIKHPVPDRVKPSFVIFDIRTL